MLRAASRIVDQRDFLVVGSAAILGSFGETLLPAAATRSDEAGLAPYDDPDGAKSLALEGSLGQGSMFHRTFGCFADGVDFTTAVVPPGWETRLVAFDTPGSHDGRGLCLEPPDLAASRLAAGTDKDDEFVAALLDADLVGIGILAERVAGLPHERVLPGFLGRAQRFIDERLLGRQRPVDGVVARCKRNGRRTSVFGSCAARLLSTSDAGAQRRPCARALEPMGRLRYARGRHTLPTRPRVLPRQSRGHGPNALRPAAWGADGH